MCVCIIIHMPLCARMCMRDMCTLYVTVLHTVRFLKRSKLLITNKCNITQLI